MNNARRDGRAPILLEADLDNLASSKHRAPLATHLTPIGGTVRRPSEFSAARIDTSQALPDARLRYLARQLHRLGERPLYEYLRELARGADPWVRLEIYARINSDVLQAFGGDVLPSICEVEP